jgi:hypothetical protein
VKATVRMIKERIVRIFLELRKAMVVRCVCSVAALRFIKGKRQNMMNDWERIKIEIISSNLDLGCGSLGGNSDVEVIAGPPLLAGQPQDGGNWGKTI